MRNLILPAGLLTVLILGSCHSSRKYLDQTTDNTVHNEHNIQDLQPKQPREQPPTNIEETLPGCIETMITELKKAPVTNPPTVITEYLFNKLRVYHISAPCCDQMSRVIGEDCGLVCRPDGGITGKGDGKCSGFFEEATFLRVVFKDDRVGK